MFLSRYLLLGLAISSGLLLSCHYKGFLFAGIIYIFLYIHFKRPRLLIISALIAFFVFLVINLPLFLEFVQFRRDVQFELTHFNDGHAYPVYFTQTAGLFHLTKSLFPGVGLWVILIVGLTILMSIRIFRSPQVILVLSLLIIYWMVLEFGPLKPHPDYGRYALPLVPMLFILFAIASGYWKEKYSTFNYINPTVIVLIGVLSIYRSWPLVQHLTPDTRNQVALEYEELKEHCYFELYALPHPDWSHPHKLVDLSVDSLLQSGFTTAMISSFWYERFIYGAGLPSVDSIIIQKSDYYTLAIDCEIRRFESESGFYAFSNPLIHEIDLVKFSSLLAQTGIASGH
jgi:hypothetical protein